MKIWNYLSDYKFGIFNRYWWREYWYSQISSRIWPRQRWLTQQIPRTYRDKDTLIELCVLECLKDYIEGEEALGKDMCHFQSSQEDPEYPSWQKDTDREVKHYYELTTQKLVALEKELEVEWGKIPSRGLRDINNSKPGDYEQMYGSVDRLEKEIYDLQTEIMVWVVKNRNILWT